MIETIWDRKKLNLSTVKWTNIRDFNAGPADYIDQSRNAKRRFLSLGIVPPTECEETHAPILHPTDAQPANGGRPVWTRKR